KTDPATRERAVWEYKNGALQFLLNYGVFTEGFDAPSTGMIVMGRPTKSILTYTQQLGRGTRPLPGTVDGLDTAEARKDAITASKKPFLTVLDFVGNSKHRLVSATDVLGGNYDVEIRDIADEITRERGEGRNVRDAMEKARAASMFEAEEQKRRAIRF